MSFRAVVVKINYKKIKCPKYKQSILDSSQLKVTDGQTINYRVASILKNRKKTVEFYLCLIFCLHFEYLTRR